MSDAKEIPVAVDAGSSGRSVNRDSDPEDDVSIPRLMGQTAGQVRRFGRDLWKTMVDEAE